MARRPPPILRGESIALTTVGRVVVARQQPAEPAREAMVRMLRDRAASLRVSAVIFPHAGFQAAVVRVHSSIEQGAEWIVSMMGPDAKDPPPSAADLVGAVEALRG